MIKVKHGEKFWFTKNKRLVKINEKEILQVFPISFNNRFADVNVWEFSIENEVNYEFDDSLLIFPVLINEEYYYVPTEYGIIVFDGGDEIISEFFSFKDNDFVDISNLRLEIEEEIQIIGLSLSIAKVYHNNRLIHKHTFSSNDMFLGLSSMNKINERYNREAEVKRTTDKTSILFY